MLRVTSLIITVTALIGVLIIILGYRNDPHYKGTMTFEVEYTVSNVWEVLLDLKQIPSRKRDVQSVEILEQQGTLYAWQENLKRGGYRIYRMNKRIDRQELVIELTESSYGLTGIWTFNLATIEFDPRGTAEITISEESTLTDIRRRGYRVIFGRNYDLLVWQKYIRVGLMEELIGKL